MSKPYAYLALLLIAGCGNPAIDEPDSSQSADLAMPDISGPAGCSPACAGLTSKCNAAKHCVGCLADSDCAMGTYCKIVSDAVASCVPGCNVDANCGNGQKCCSGQCIDPMTDARNCGDCAAACMTPNSGAACVGGMCVAGQCKPGYGDCNKDPKDGCETNLHIDPNNCVMCGAACDIPNAYASCADGCYSTACKFGFDDCNMNPMDGCETAVRSDPKNCGSCGKSCTMLPNAMAGCANGNCILQSCNQGYADCDKMANNGCEVLVATDANNCGACGNVCPQGTICKQGGCTCPNCNIPNASAKCVNNICVFDKCNPGFADCNNNTADGCEINLLNDGKNCNGCGNACPLNTPACVNGMCSAEVLLTAVCGKQAMIFCGGNCSNNHAQYADWYCQLAGFTKSTSYQVLTMGSVNCVYYNGGQNQILNSCNQVMGPTNYGLADFCDAVTMLKCQ